MIAIKVPPLGESIVEATISRWVKREGEAVSAGDTLVELETDKITVEVPAPSSGVLAKRLKAEGDVVAVDEALGEIDESGAAGAGAAGASTAAVGAAAGAAGAGTAAAGTAPAAAPTAPPAAAHAEVRASPAAQRVAAERGVDLAGVAGTGRGGVVSKPDVLQAAKAPTASAGASAAPAAPASAAPGRVNGASRETREKMTTRRRRIAENLLASQQQTAHLTTFNEIDMSAVSALRDRVRERVEKEHGVRLSFMPFFVKAAVMALETYPLVNASLDGDTIVHHHYVNMGIAVASEAGLVVPNIKDADRKGTLEISRDIVALAKKARDGKLTMEDLTGGTFTITNGGVFGSLISTPIINFPQVAILGLHKIQDRPVAVNGQVVIRPMMYVALSYDHRLIDGQQAVLFLVRVKELMEDPSTMLIA
ncbi:2-oxoglutarate dehydrogenase, E2 subunit, dihydrolipoamide succinyltransferase [Gemmatirosa kalamazoonensis]|uniref:Dihydrolipoyllysine-residue succinyltransferase component of 2-oxoglutarate dehydrogenase complex n=1 Tax=Gemmatirosa kalamazoonensis TaxID=861299 RepID=W0RGL8_9BACT|nr:2-oxoglutarate dehydrogenase complex dihydrolipoyllysine-residue succinyltransferase [Gemmatirosa kalamazoonensis]AHG89926.1 2-oxoglutarate dehydrogenase, E2 subunit, dihydrolipoamide succinyltransferase [Gemmatirosa kalamazoonensis]